MKIRLLAIYILSICFISTMQGQTPDEEIGGLINKTDYFELNRQYTLLKDSIHPAIRSLAACLLDDAFNRPEEACKAIEYLCQNHQELGFDNILNMIIAWGQNLIKSGRYADAADLLNAQINNPDVQAHASEQIQNGLKNLYRRAAVLRNYPKSEIIRPDKDCAVSIIREISNKDKRNLTYKINVKIGEKQTPFIFDTGADAPAFISEKFAKEHGIKIIGDSILTAGITATGYTKIGFIDSLKIGEITYCNLWAIVSPQSEIRYKDSVIAQVDAVLGRYFMDEIGEFQIIPSKGEIVFPMHESQMPENRNNVVLIGGQPYIEAHSNDERLSLHFDTGGGCSLNSTYYRKHKDKIEATCLSDSSGIGGWGGARRIPIYKLLELPLTIAGTNCMMRDIDIFTEDLRIGSICDGSLGMDFVELFEKVVFNFDKMFISVENKKTK